MYVLIILTLPEKNADAMKQPELEVESEPSIAQSKLVESQ